jgi:hypothetical protein
MGTTRPPQRHDDDTHDGAGHGCADQGTEFNPADVPEDDPESTGRTRPAPAPGVPVTNEEYERLKDEARRRRGRDDAPAQEDVPQNHR